MAVYQFVLHHKEATPGHITAALKLSSPVVVGSLNTLQNLSMVWVDGGGSPTLKAASPKAGLTHLLATYESETLLRVQAADKASILIDSLVDEYADSRLSDRRDTIETLQNAEESRLRTAELTSVADEEVAICCTGTSIAVSVELVRSWQNAGLHPGRTVRCVIPDSVTRSPGRRHLAQGLAQLGVEVRTVTSLVDHMVIVEGRSAILPQSAEPGSGACVVVHAVGVVAALAYYFENLWHQASPLGAVGDADRDFARRPNPPFTSAEHLTLQMLAEGTTDEAIARKLDISVRTVRRTVVKLIQVLGARSRFEAAVLAAKHGWV